MDYKELILEEEGGIATITLNRPEKLNALNWNLAEWELPAALREIGQNEAVKVVIITGAGRGFCTGGDVGGLEARKERPRQVIREPLESVILDVTRLDKVTIAAVNGITAGAGFSLAMACDMRIASEEAKFSSEFVKLGIIPDSALAYHLPRLIGTAKSLEIMLIGDVVDAREAERLGIVNRVVSHDKLMQETKRLASRIVQGPPLVVSWTKRAVYKGIIHDLEAHLYFETQAQRRLMKTEDFKEGVAAFLEKRPPVFKGR